MPRPEFLSRIKEEMTGVEPPKDALRAAADAKGYAPVTKVPNPALEAAMRDFPEAMVIPPSGDPPLPNPSTTANGGSPSGRVDPVARRKANEAYYTERNDRILDNKQELVENGGTTTLRTATVGGEKGEPGYIIPTYDPDTKTVYDLRDPVQRKKAMAMVEADIKSGKLQPYERWQDAEADLKDFYPRVIDMKAREKRKAQAAATHAAPKGPAGQSPAFLEKIKMEVANGELGPIPSAVRRAAVESQTNRSLTDPKANLQVPQSMDPAAVMGTENEVPSSIADPLTRQRAIGPLQTAGRIAVEGAANYVGGGVGTQVAERAALPIAKRVLPSVGRAVGTALGSLGAQGFDPVEDPWGTAAYAAGFSGVADGVVGALSALRPSNTAGWAGDLEVGAKDAQRLLGPGNQPSVGRLTKNRTLDLAENITENSIMGGGVVTRRNERASLRARELIGKFVQKFTGGASRSDVDRLVHDISEKRMGAFKQSAEGLYGEVDKLAPNGVGTIDLIKLRNALVTEYQDGIIPEGMEQLVYGIDRTLKVPRKLRGIQKNVMISTDPPPPRWEPSGLKPGQPGFDPLNSMVQIQDPPTAAGSVTFRAMQKLRSDVLSVKEGANSSFPGQLVGNAKRVAKTADDIIESSAANLDPQAYQFWRIANQFWKDGADAFGEQVMRTLANQRPDQLFTTIMQGNHPQQIARFRKLVLGGTGGADDTALKIEESAKRTLRDPTAHPVVKEIAQRRLDGLAEGKDAWNKFVGQFMTNVVTGADEAAGISHEAAKGTRTLIGSTALDRFRAYGDDTLREIFPRASQRRQAERFLRTLEVTQSGTGLGTGKIGVQLMQWGAITGSAFSPSITARLGAAALVIGPAAVGRLMDSESFIRWATVAARAKPGSPEAARAFAQMATIAVRAGARFNDANGNVVNPEQETEHQRRFKQTAGAANRQGGYR